MKYIFTTIYVAVLFCGEPIAALGQQTVSKKDAQVITREMLEKLYPALEESPAPLSIKLLSGYSHKSAIDFEGNKIGVIWMERKATIRYEIGLSQGPAVDLDQRNNYVWYKEQVINNRKIIMALNKQKTILITIKLDNKSDWHAANFYCKFEKSEDIVDIITMVLSFEP